MAQNFPTTAQVVYETLAADSVFGTLLGEYDFKANNGPIPAISIVSAGQDLPSLRNVTGVECIIQDAGNTSTFNYLSGDSPDLVVTWSVFLVSWKGSTGADLQQASQRILQRFPLAFSTQTVATPDGLGSLVQTKVEIPSNCPILPE